MDYHTIARHLARELVMLRLAEPVVMTEGTAPEYDEAIVRRALEGSAVEV